MSNLEKMDLNTDVSIFMTPSLLLIG